MMYHMSCDIVMLVQYIITQRNLGAWGSGTAFFSGGPKILQLIINIDIHIELVCDVFNGYGLILNNIIHCMN